VLGVPKKKVLHKYMLQVLTCLFIIFVCGLCMMLPVTGAVAEIQDRQGRSFPHQDHSRWCRRYSGSHFHSESVDRMHTL